MSNKETSIFIARIRAGSRIEEFYPQYKRENILDQASPYTQADLDKFRTFRDAVRNRCNEYEQQAEAGETPLLDYSDLEP
jgi:hypothetical protein